MPVQKVCVICGKGFNVPPCRANTATTCSHECAVFVRAKSRERKAPVTCKGCGVVFLVPRSVQKKRAYCSKECHYRSDHAVQKMVERFAGKKNPMWKGGVSDHSEGYRYQSSPAHPYASNGYVFQHRLTVELAMRKQSPAHPFLVQHGDNLYLSPEVSVHHIDTDRKHNELKNLVAITPGAHARIRFGYMPAHKDYWPNDKATENRLRKAINKRKQP